MKKSISPIPLWKCAVTRLQQQLLKADIDFTASGVFKRSPLPPFYWDGKQWWSPSDDGQFYMTPLSVVVPRLVEMGLSRMGGAKFASPVEVAIGYLQEKHSVNYAGPLAGYPTGIHYQPGNLRILVTAETKPISAHQGEWPTLRRVIENLLKSEEYDQTPYFYGHAKMFLEGYWATYHGKGNPMPGQALILCGPRDCGKTLLKSVLIELFGGRVAAPHEHMLGQTTFNADLVEAPILEIDDEAASKDPRDRLRLAAEIKQLVANPRQRAHPKYQKPVTLTPCQRLIVCVNDEPENMMVLPMLDQSMEDKLMLMKARKCEMPMPTPTQELRNAFWDQLMSELPAFAHFLLHEFEIPEALRGGRFGVKHFHHPELLALLSELDTTEERVMEMIDDMFAYDTFSERFDSKQDPLPKGECDPIYRTKPWEGSSSEFEAILRSRYRNRGTDQIFKYGNSAGMLLRNLANAHPDRVKRGKLTHGYARWTINPPRNQDEFVMGHQTRNVG